MFSQNRLHIKNLFIYSESIKDSFYDIGILTDNNDYIEYSIEIQLNHISWYLEDRFRQLFRPFYLDSSSDVMVCDTVGERQPLYLYLMILRSHIEFNMQRVSKNKVFSRLGKRYERKLMSKNEKLEEKKYKAKNIKYIKKYDSSCLNKIWKLLISLKTCPWISLDIDNYIKLLPISQENRRKTIRLCLLYMIVKNYYCDKNKRLKLKKQNLEQ